MKFGGEPGIPKFKEETEPIMRDVDDVNVGDVAKIQGLPRKVLQKIRDRGEGIRFILEGNTTLYVANDDEDRRVEMAS